MRFFADIVAVVVVAAVAADAAGPSDSDSDNDNDSDSIWNGSTTNPAADGVWIQFCDGCFWIFSFLLMLTLTCHFIFVGPLLATTGVLYKPLQSMPLCLESESCQCDSFSLHN